MANRWGNNGNSDRPLFSWAPKSLKIVTAAMKLKDTCSLKKSYDQPRQHIKTETLLCQQRSSVKAMVSPVVMYGCESWTIKKAERRRIDAFELWCWRTLESPLDCKECNQSILKEISPEYSLEGLMLTLKSDTLAS